MTAAVVALPAHTRLTTTACAALEVSRAAVHPHRVALTAPPREAKPRPASGRALPESARDQVLAYLRTPRFADQTLAEVYATLPGEGVDLCRVRTMYLDPCRPWRGCGTPPPAPPTGLAEARTAGRGTQSEPAPGLTGGLVLGVRRGLAWPGSNGPGDSLKRRTPS